MHESEYAERTVKKHYGLIAGGYVRDTALGLTPKDMDLFFAEGQREAVLRDMKEHVSLLQKDISDYAAHPYVTRVYSVIGKSIDLVFTRVNPIQHVIKGFDLGICKCYTDCITPAVFSEQCLADMLNKTITYHRNETLHNDKLVMRHALRLQRRFPDYRIEVQDATT